MKPESQWLKVYSLPGKYPKLWCKGIIQKTMKQWADHRCECCGAGEDAVLLHVHHLIWIGKHRCRWEDLLVCCTGCHTRIHNLKWQPGKPWLDRWGSVPEWAIIRGLLDVNGNPVNEGDK